MRISDWISDMCSSDLREFACEAFFDRNMRTIRTVEIEGAARRHDHELHAVASGGDRQRIGTDLVGGIPVSGDPVGTDDHPIDLLAAHQMRDRAIGDQPCRDAFLLQLPGRQPRRSEEHTSELQSLMRISYAVFCLKKKNTHRIIEN